MSTRQLRRFQQMTMGSTQKPTNEEELEEFNPFTKSEGEGASNAFDALKKKKRRYRNRGKKAQAKRLEASAEEEAEKKIVAEENNKADSKEEDTAEGEVGNISQEEGAQGEEAQEEGAQGEKAEEEETQEEDDEDEQVDINESTDSDYYVSDDDEEELSEPPVQSEDSSLDEKPKKSTNKKKSQKKKSTSKYSHSEESVERAVEEVNRLLGRPQPVPSVSRGPPPAQPTRVEYKYLDARAELNHSLGERENQRRKRREASTLKYRIRVEVEAEPIPPFKGLYMEKIAESGGVKYFKFRHEPGYLGALQTITDMLRYLNWVPALRSYPVATFEGFLQRLDMYFEASEHETASKDLQSCVNAVQTVIAPAFSYVDGKTRLEYKHVENRPFHIMLLKYMYILTNKALHRTAFEIAKLLLNLDPSDPLAVIFIIDVLALRARRPDVVLELYNDWQWERDAERLHNFLYSRALAQYTIARKTKTRADEDFSNMYLRDALMMFPYVAVRLIEVNHHDVSDFRNNPMHELAKTTPEHLMDLQKYYCEMVAPRWRDVSGALGWLIQSYKAVQDEFVNPSLTTRNILQATAEQRDAIFRNYPLELKRHLAIISSMSSLLVEGKAPEVPRTLGFNPYPAEGESVDEHSYYVASNERIDMFQALLSSMLLDRGLAQYDPYDNHHDDDDDDDDYD